MNLRQLALAGGALVAGLLVMANQALADKSPAPRKVESPKVTLPVQVKNADLAGEGDGVKYKLVVPARLQTLEGKKVGASEIAPPQRSLVAAVVLSLAAVSAVVVLRGKRLSKTSKGAILGIAALVGVSSIAFANVAPVPRPEPKPVAGGKIVIEFSADVEEAVLTIGK